MVFDLDQPNAYASVHGSLSECQYQRNPVSAPRIRGMVFVRDSKGRPIRDPKNPLRYKTKKGDTEWHGQTDGISGKKPRGSVKLTGGARGLLTYSYCELDRKGKDGGLPCRAPGTKNTYVKLVNKLDLEADKWSASTSKTRIASTKKSVSSAKKSKKTGTPGRRLTRKAASKASGKTLMTAKRATLTSASSKAAKKKQAAAKKRAAKAKALQALPTKIQKLLAARNARTKKQKK